MEELLQKIIRWAESEEAIRALILTSSRAGASEIDEFSDYDIMVVTDHADQYLGTAEWIRKIEPVWVYQKEGFMRGVEEVPTRLVIFQKGRKVDFSFWKTEIIRDFITNGFSGTDDLNRGYQVLLDKDGLTKELPPPTIKFFKITKPTQDEFLTTIYDFWFEIAGVAKYLARKDLFFAKKIDNGIVKDLFLRMIIWNTQAKHNWEANTHTDGKKMKSWVDPETLQSLVATYSAFNLEDSWKSLVASMDCWRTISGETSKLLGYDYPQLVDKEIQGYVDGIRRIPA